MPIQTFTIARSMRQPGDGPIYSADYPITVAPTSLRIDADLLNADLQDPATDVEIGLIWLPVGGDTARNELTDPPGTPVTGWRRLVAVTYQGVPGNTTLPYARRSGNLSGLVGGAARGYLRVVAAVRLGGTLIVDNP